MSYWSIAILIASVTFLAYNRAPQIWTSLPPWLRAGNIKALAKSGKSGNDRKDEQTNARSMSKPKTETTALAPSFDISETVDEAEDEGTPKAHAVHGNGAIPGFSLDEPEVTKSSAKSNDIFSTPFFPATNSAQRASTRAPPVKPTGQQPSFSLMPPPAPKPASLMPPPGRPNVLPQRTPALNNSLRIPSNGPLPNRGPPANSSQRAGSKSSGKIQLSPGHSPMDWAALSRNSNLSGVPTLQRVTPSQLKTMTGRKGKPAWSSYQGKVYNITPYLPFHPGGEPELMKAAGRDGGNLFMEVHPWVNWEGMMGQSCVVGILVSESEAVNPMDEQD